MKYNLSYRSNAERRNLGSFECEGEPFSVAKKILEENGYSLDLEWGRWETEAKGEETDLRYVAIVPPYGAASIVQYKGFVYEILSKENNHLHTPHIHVSFDGEKMSVNLNDFACVGTAKNQVKANEAICFIQANKEDFLKAWDYVINEKNIKKAYDLFRQPKYRKMKGVD